ncbi:MAG: hypothetical protein NVSMB64_25790 [Candidatus Velthaea sp.]
MAETPPAAIRKSANLALSGAKTAKQDEFYTQLNDISNELKYYKAQLHGKTVLCNCDDPFESNFFKYFALNFNALGLRKLIATSYSRSPIVGKQLPLLAIEGLKPSGIEPYAVEITEVPDHKKRGATDISDVEYLLTHEANTAHTLHEDGDFPAGDFRSRDCITLLQQADVVVTNPPFSLFREFVAQLVQYEKQFLIIGNMNALHYAAIFKLLKDNRIWLGESIHSGDREFRVPDHYPLQAAGSRVDANGVKYIRVKGVRWFTNMDNPNRHEYLPLYKKYLPADYPTYDNLGAIEVAKAMDIPCDYDGLIGVPDSFLDKFNPEQFELIGIPFGNLGKELGVTKNYRGRTDIAITKDGKSRCPYSRIIIRRKS